MTDVDITAVPLTVVEESRLADLVSIVHAAIETWADAGNALDAIRAGQLYRATHSTFEAFVEDEFGYARQHAYRMIAAAKVAEIVSPIGDIANAGQARELVGLEPEHAREVYQRAVAETAGRPTAAAIAEARQEIAPKPIKEASKPRRNSLPDRYISTIWELDKITRRLDEMHRDDRFRSHRADLADRHEKLLTEIVGRVAALADDLAGVIA